MRFVLDASVTLTWAFPDEWHKTAQRAKSVLESPNGAALVPSLWWFEVRNILVVNERRGRIRPEGTTYFLQQLSEMNIETVPITDEAALLELARQKKLSVYDSAYLAIAMENNIPLSTLDEKLISAAASIDVELLA
ncbi:MAG TPA: type II toxin-antitoxin system VapC family toxin [Terracidiphilus sp.]